MRTSRRYLRLPAAQCQCPGQELQCWSRSPQGAAMQSPRASQGRLGEPPRKGADAPHRRSAGSAAGCSQHGMVRLMASMGYWQIMPACDVPCSAS